METDNKEHQAYKGGGECGFYFLNLIKSNRSMQERVLAKLKPGAKYSWPQSIFFMRKKMVLYVRRENSSSYLEALRTLLCNMPQASPLDTVCVQDY